MARPLRLAAGKRKDPLARSCARSATDALTHATLGFLLKLAQDPHTTLRDHPGLRNGLQLYRGQVTHAGLAEDLGLPYASAESLLA